MSIFLRHFFYTKATRLQIGSNVVVGETWAFGGAGPTKAMTNHPQGHFIFNGSTNLFTRPFGYIETI